MTNIVSNISTIFLKIIGPLLWIQCQISVLLWTEFYTNSSSFDNFGHPNYFQDFEI